uniref:acidic phospholipase A2 E-like n=1 Tax=Myxine glutinosa TaxID=7769 RepID=UPI00358EDF02
MTALCLFTACFFFSQLYTTVGALPTSRVQTLGMRNVFQFAGLIRCVAPASPLDYNGYGCYCGLGGSGTPVDASDSCCFDHDCCYGEAQNAGCNPYFQYYGYNCENGSASCAGYNGGCARMVCECDLQAALCLQRSPYKSFFRRWPTESCTGSSPPCHK